MSPLVYLFLRDLEALDALIAASLPAKVVPDDWSESLIIRAATAAATDAELEIITKASSVAPERTPSVSVAVLKVSQLGNRWRGRYVSCCASVCWGLLLGRF